MRVQLRLSHFTRNALVLTLPLLGLGCSPKAGKPMGPPDAGFAVSDYFAPSGAMGDGATPGLLTITVDDETKCKARPSGAKGDCYAFDYTPGPALFAGLYWQSPANNWGSSPGVPIRADKLTRVSFQAAVKSGSESMTFEIGGIGLPPDPTLDAQRAAMGDVNNDQFINKDVFTVSGDWQRFSLLIPAPSDPKKPIRTLIGAFAWYASYPALPSTTDPATFDYSSLPPKTIFIDDLVYE